MKSKEQEERKHSKYGRHFSKSYQSTKPVKEPTSSNASNSGAQIGNFNLCKEDLKAFEEFCNPQPTVPKKSLPVPVVVAAKPSVSESFEEDEYNIIPVSSVKPAQIVFGAPPKIDAK